MNLFQTGIFPLHSGSTSKWKIDCDALTNGDLETLAAIAVGKLTLRIGKVEGVPTGGLRLAHMLERYSVPFGHLLIVDDVLTTGQSMEEQRDGREAMGIVIFARGKCPSWVKTIFTIED